MLGETTPATWQRGAMQRAFSFSAASQALLLAYLEIMEWVNLYPWNDVRAGAYIGGRIGAKVHPCGSQECAAPPVADANGATH
jgi:hypothetical protein